MSKSRGNAIELAMDADTTARRVAAAVTDGDRNMTYDPARRPEVSNLVLLGALASGRDPHEVAAEIGDRGANALKRFVSDAVNEHLAPIRARRAEVAADPDHVHQVLAAGNARANEIAEATLDETRAAMHMRYD
jgi:tryptophanyl-tRNA synthetase